jgi:hypothetical protein
MQRRTDPEGGRMGARSNDCGYAKPTVFMEEERSRHKAYAISGQVATPWQRGQRQYRELAPYIIKGTDRKPWNRGHFYIKFSHAGADREIITPCKVIERIL